MNNLVENAYKWLNVQVKAEKMRRKVFEAGDDVTKCAGSPTEKEIQVVNILPLLDVLGISSYRSDWDGNKNCGTDYDIVWFYYLNYKFFELVEKEKDNEGK